MVQRPQRRRRSHAPVEALPKTPTLEFRSKASATSAPPSSYTVERSYQSSSGFPAEERFGLTSQLRRAAVSVSANIAEGAARTASKEFLQFLSIASGSLAEAKTLLLLAHRLRMLERETYTELFREASELGKMLTGLKRSLRFKL
ncbi:four helix bundle protein [uncultured Thiohalocapsa sp.]|uniref:four helix bundle protein n=1 Tax=uncultured Thiohalocapsa sp. TaxID=768990 RepID=UPI0025E9013D|nr:four helix bundle protein [uncultured Thiohalocapsa sp.]